MHRARSPRATRARSRATCATRGALADETKHRQARYEGSFRQRRGSVMAELRAHDSVAVADLDRDALGLARRDGLAEIAGTTAQLPAGQRRRLSRRGACEEVAQQVVARRR